MVTLWKVKEYLDANGVSPFRFWLDRLSWQTRARIQATLFKSTEGNLGDYKNVGGGIFEMRIHFGPGYRVYFAFSGSSVILLLAGGDKSSQLRDIRRAKESWMDFKRRKSND